MRNEELAQRIQAGERDLLPKLWAGVEKFIAMKAGILAYRLDGFGGVTDEDLYQSGFLALVEAVATYNPETGTAFITWLGTCLKTAFAKAAGYRSAKRDALDFAADLDAQLPGAEDFTLADTIESPQAAREFEDVEREVWLQQLRDTLDAALDGLPDGQGAAIRAHYYEGKPLRELAEEKGVSVSQVHQTERKALRALYRNRKRNRLADFVEERTPYFLHIGVNRYRSTHCSAVEEIVLLRERIEGTRENAN